MIVHQSLVQMLLMRSTASQAHPQLHRVRAPARLLQRWLISETQELLVAQQSQAEREAQQKLAVGGAC